nr:GNAT family N-acetyltransferase [Aurantimonas sp. VKM B-3413]
MEAHLGHVPEALIRHRTRETFARRAGERLKDVFVAAGEAGRIAGFLRVHGEEIEQVFVDPAFRGIGVTDRLMQAGEALLLERGIEDAFLVVNQANTRAQRFYGRQGWRPVGMVDYSAETEDGEFVIPILRFEKTLRDRQEER